MIDDDCLRCIILLLPASDILRITQVNNHFRLIARNVNWEILYKSRVKYFADVSVNFNWKIALLMVEASSAEVQALCIWDKQIVRVMAPWKDQETTFLHGSTVVMGALKQGVLRDLEASDVTQGVTIHFIYDDAFELKGIRHTCIRRGELVPCKRCEQRKGCDNQQYMYYIRKLDHPKVNDHLCRRVRGVIV